MIKHRARGGSERKTDALERNWLIASVIAMLSRAGPRNSQGLIFAQLNLKRKGCNRVTSPLDHGGLQPHEATVARHLPGLKLSSTRSSNICVCPRFRWRWARQGEDGACERRTEPGAQQAGRNAPHAHQETSRDDAGDSWLRCSLGIVRVRLVEPRADGRVASSEVGGEGAENGIVVPDARGESVQSQAMLAEHLHEKRSVHRKPCCPLMRTQSVGELFADMLLCAHRMCFVQTNSAQKIRSACDDLMPQNSILTISDQNNILPQCR